MLLWSFFMELIFCFSVLVKSDLEISFFEFFLNLVTSLFIEPGFIRPEFFNSFLHFFIVNAETEESDSDALNSDTPPQPLVVVKNNEVVEDTASTNRPKTNLQTAQYVAILFVTSFVVLACVSYYFSYTCDAPVRQAAEEHALRRYTPMYQDRLYRTIIELMKVGPDDCRGRPDVPPQHVARETAQMFVKAYIESYYNHLNTYIKSKKLIKWTIKICLIFTFS